VSAARGTVIKRGNRYTVVIDKGRNPATGKRLRDWHSGFRYRKDAEQKRTELLRQLDTGSYVEPSRVTMGEFLDEWMEAMRPVLGENTRSLYGVNIEAHIRPRLGAVRLRDLQASKHLNPFYADLRKNGRRNGKVDSRTAPCESSTSSSTGLSAMLCGGTG
jgi:hypothetical protein